MSFDVYAQIILWAYPLSLFTVFLSAKLFFHFRSRNRKVLHREQEASHQALFWQQFVLTALLAISCVLHFLFFKKSILRNSHVAYSEALLSSTMAVLFFFLAGLAPDPDEPFTATLPSVFVWATASLFETLQVALIYGPRFGLPERPETPSLTAAASSTARVVLLILMIFTYYFLSRQTDFGDKEETERLLGNENGNGHANCHGKGSASGTYGSTKLSNVPEAPKKTFDPQSSTWLNYVAGFSKLFPFIWPTSDVRMQAIAIMCFGILITQRIVNVLVPYQLGVLVDALGSGKLPYREIGLYVLFRGLQGQQGVLGSIRAILWIPIQQSTYKRLTAAVYAHVLTLSLDFHLSKKIGEVMSALSKGAALNTFLDGFAFQLFPMVADLFVAAVFFFIKFDAFYSLIVIAIMWAYIFVTIYMAKYRGRARRQMTNRDREMEAAKTDAIMAYETVHQNCAVTEEVSKFQKLVRSFQAAEWSVLSSLNFLNSAQNIIFVIGILIVCLLSAYEISIDIQKISTFVALLAYFTQLQAPLNFFGSFYTQVQNNLVDAERMMSLFDEKPQVVDAPTANPLASCRGKVTFSNVNFAYDERRPALHDVSFTVAPGTTTAIVGESGSGKSTCLKLLFRFYEVRSGSILIDDRDVNDVTIESLREYIGVVPQDTILFNETIMYNVRYANPQAQDEDVFEACARAKIHNKIMAFPDGYDSSVGERGLRLSGGEKQRVSIARAILKRAPIMLLDEATASLDSETEKDIQASLEEATENRTTITIAHRLSTITKADQILVFHQGRIVERGTHSELLALKGRYAYMWEKQTTSEEKARAREGNLE